MPTPPATKRTRDKFQRAAQRAPPPAGAASTIDLPPPPTYVRGGLYPALADAYAGPPRPAPTDPADPSFAATAADFVADPVQFLQRQHPHIEFDLTGKTRNRPPSSLERVSSRSRPARRRLLRTHIDILLAMRSQVRLTNHWRNCSSACDRPTASHLEGATGRRR